MITIRRFSPEDSENVKALIVRIMDDEFSDQKSAYPTEDIQQIDRFYGGLGDAFFVAVIDGKIVGTIAIKKEDARIALLRRLFVCKEFRRQQIGLRLIDKALEFCKELGYDEIVFRTTSRMQNAAKACQKRGFLPRAKIQMGSIELMKFALSLRNGLKSPSKVS